MNTGYLFLIVILYSTKTVLSKQEEESHGAGNPNKHNPIHREHFHEGEHDSHYDHEAILGDKELEKEFDELPPEEAKRRLKILANDMDKDKDGYVTKEELTSWILTSFAKLDEEDSSEQFGECDLDNDGKMSWKEYLSHHHGFNAEEYKDYSDEDALADFTSKNKVVGEEKKKFDAADVNKDGFLTRKEHICFLYPAEYPHMHAVEIERFMKEHDKDSDGIITEDEFIGEVDKTDKELLAVEKERFEEYDKNKDRKLDHDEIKDWVIPNNKEAAAEEADHLLERTDDGKDGKLSIDEIVNHHEDFVGSQATNYGEYLPKDEL